MHVALCLEGQPLSDTAAERYRLWIEKGMTYLCPSQAWDLGSALVVHTDAVL